MYSDKLQCKLHLENFKVVKRTLFWMNFARCANLSVLRDSNDALHINSQKLSLNRIYITSKPFLLRSTCFTKHKLHNFTGGQYVPAGRADISYDCRL